MCYCYCCCYCWWWWRFLVVVVVVCVSVCVLVYMCYPSFNFAGLGLFILCVFVGVISLFHWSFPSSTYSGAGSVDRDCLSLSLSWNVLPFPPMVFKSFAVYSRLGWHLWSLRIIQSLLGGCFLPWFLLPSLVSQWLCPRGKFFWISDKYGSASSARVAGMRKNCKLTKLNGV